MSQQMLKSRSSLPLPRLCRCPGGKGGWGQLVPHTGGFCWHQQSQTRVLGALGVQPAKRRHGEPWLGQASPCSRSSNRARQSCRNLAGNHNLAKRPSCADRRAGCAGRNSPAP